MLILPPITACDARIINGLTNVPDDVFTVNCWLPENTWLKSHLITEEITTVMFPYSIPLQLFM